MTDHVNNPRPLTTARTLMVVSMLMDEGGDAIPGPFTRERFYLNPAAQASSSSDG